MSSCPRNQNPILLCHGRFEIERRAVRLCCKAASFLHQKNTRRNIPIIAGSQRQCNVTLIGSHCSKPHEQGERRGSRQHCRLQCMACAPRGEQPCTFKRIAVSARKPLAVEPSAHTPRRMKQPCHARLIKRACSNTGIIHYARRHTPMFMAARKGACSSMGSTIKNFSHTRREPLSGCSSEIQP